MLMMGFILIYLEDIFSIQGDIDSAQYIALTSPLKSR